MLDTTEVGVIAHTVKVYKVVAVTTHLLKDDTALGKGYAFTAVGVDNLLGVVDAEIVKGIDNLVHGSLPFAAVHGVDGIVKGDACKHSYGKRYWIEKYNWKVDKIESI